MLSLPPSVRIYLCAVPTDMRRSFDGLAALTEELIGENPLSGHLFVFRNKRGDRIKILSWDRTGCCLWYKRLEQGVFHFPSGDRGGIEVAMADLLLLLEGIDLHGARRRPRFHLERKAV